MKYISCKSLLGCEVKNSYRQQRVLGKNREAAISFIKEMYSDMLDDEEDRIEVLVGLALALSEKNELTRQIGSEAIAAIKTLSATSKFDKSWKKYLFEIEVYLQDDELYGEEAAYKRRIKYISDWKVGDTFAHKITCPQSQFIDIFGWFILLYNAGEYTDKFDKSYHLVYISLCRPDQLPSSSSELQELGFLRIMQHGQKWDYLMQVELKNKRSELAYGLMKIGNFQRIASPSDSTDENPLVSMPLTLKRSNQGPWPVFEEQICRLYKWYGVGRT